MSILQLRSSEATLAARRPGLGQARSPRRVRLGLRALERAADLLLTWQERAQQRHQLETLNDHMLRDIGLTRADVMAEATKPFWQG
jgi:uncharacterized protein YjiS (DUF1127 family)